MAADAYEVALQVVNVGVGDVDGLSAHSNPKVPTYEILETWATFIVAPHLHL